MTDETNRIRAPRPATPAAAWPGMILAVLLLILAGAAGAVPQEGGDGGAGGEAAEPAAEEVAEPAAAPQGGEGTGDDGKTVSPGRGPEGSYAPPDGEWLVDDLGRRYFIDKVEKGRFQRLSEDVVRPANMPALKIEREDEDYFYFRVYEPQSVQAWKPGREATQEDLARYEAAELEQVDLLRFDDFGRGLPERGQWRNGFALADMNGDGHLDLVHGPARKMPGTPRIFLGDGAGNWQVWAEAGFEPAPYDYGDATVADFDGDGRMDAAFGIHLIGAVALVQREAGQFYLWNEGIPMRTDKDADIDFSGREVATHDWNGDGRPDLLVLSEGPASMPREPGDDVKASPSGVRVYLNRGDGTWESLDSTYRDRSFGDALLVTDLDGDGRADMVTGSRTIGYDEVVKLGTEEGRWRAVALEPLPDRALVWSLASGDFDADGKTDLAVGYRDNLWGVQREVVDVLLNRSEPGGLKWERRMMMARSGFDRFAALGTGDVDGDGRLDLVALDDLGDTHVLLGNGDGSFRRELSPELAPSAGHRHCAGYEVHLRDLDGDGRDEILAGFAGEPGGEQYLLGLLETRCRERGALRGWTPVPAGSDGGDTGGAGG